MFQSQYLSFEVSDGNQPNTALSGVMIIGSECPLLCGFLETSPETDDSATVTLNLNAGGEDIGSVTLPCFPASRQSFVSPLIYPWVSGEEQIFFTTTVTGTDGSYSVTAGIK